MQHNTVRKTLVWFALGGGKEGVVSRALCTQGKNSTTERYPQTTNTLFWKQALVLLLTLTNSVPSIELFNQSRL